MEKHLFVPDDWKRWIAENILRDQPVDELVRILVENGFPHELAQLEIEAASAHPYVEAARSTARRLQKQNWMLETLARLDQYKTVDVVDRRDQLSSDEFLNEYYVRNRPVVMTRELENWQARSKWTRSYLEKTVGSELVEIQANRNADANYEIENDRHRRTIRFAEFLELVFDRGSTNDYYMTANNAGVNARFLAALLEDCGTLPKFMDESQRLLQTFFWMGPAGTITPIHHDLTNNFMAQIVGRKLVKLISPTCLPHLYNHLHCYSQVAVDNIDYQRFPLFRNVHITELTLNPGDLFFLPVGWWHYVRGLDISITITCTNFRYPNSFTDNYRTYAAI